MTQRLHYLQLPVLYGFDACVLYQITTAYMLCGINGMHGIYAVLYLCESYCHKMLTPITNELTSSIRRMRGIIAIASK